jgi:hypothetical protein
MGEQDDLAQADRHIAQAEQRIEKQRMLIEEWTSRNRDTVEARAMLANMLKPLEQMRWHRDQIEAKLDEQRAKRVDGG